MKKHTRIGALALCAALALSAVGCNQTDTTTSSGSSAATDTSSNVSSAAPTGDAAAETKLPIVTEPVTLTYYVPFTSTIITSLAENTMYQELEKRTGVTIEWQHPAGDANQAFQLLIATGDLPDMVEDCLQYYTGGPDRLVEEKVAIQLNDLIDKFAPNYKKITTDFPGIAKEVVTDTGKNVAFYCVQTEHEPPWDGMRIRKDWLDELSLPIPQTVDELTATMKAFKEKKGATVPMTWYDGWKDQYGYIIGAWGIGPKIFNENGTVKYGPTAPAYKDYVTTMKGWYTDGLLDPEYLTREGAGRDELIGNNQTGVFNNTGVAALTDVKVALPYITLNKGDKRHFSNWVTNTKPANEVFITTACKNPEVAVKWLDYHYSEEGSLLFNYGVEGESYTIVDGKPEWSEYILKNPNGYTVGDLCYVLKWHQGAYNRDYMAYPGMDVKYVEAMEVWASNTDGAYVMPPVTMTSDEGASYSNIMSDINTYVDEMTNKFIMGLEPMDKFDSFVSQIDAMGIKDALAIQQAALDRYNAR